MNSASASPCKPLPHRMRTAGRGWILAILSLALAVTAWADRTKLSPGFNIFSAQQDIEIGRKSSVEAERQLPMLRDARVDNYVNLLGLKLAAHAPGAKYPFQYRCVNDMAINAFALPGGFVYVNRGTIEAADTEAQLAGVLAHETSHVVLRHGTNQVTKAYMEQAPLAVFGSLFGGTTLGSIMTRVGGLGLNALFLKNSRTDETQADVLGTQILYDSGYDDRAMAQFFEKLEAASKSRPIDFFSDHPNPEHRVERVMEEVDRLGGAPPNFRSDSREFQEIKRYVHSLPAAPKRRGPAGSHSGGGTSAVPSTGSKEFQNSEVSLSHPDNWQEYAQGSAATLAPEGGVVDDGHGNASVAYGVMLSVFQPQSAHGGSASLEDATDQLITSLRRSNRGMSVAGEHEKAQLGGQPALSTRLGNDSPVGGHETDWLITTLRPNGLFYLICVAPETHFSTYEPAFHRTLDSLRFPSN